MASSTNNTNAWSDAWQNAQQQYWDTWQKSYAQLLESMGQQNGDGSAAFNPWQQAQKQWEAMLKIYMPPGEQDNVSERMTALGQSYLAVGQAFWEALEQARQAADQGQNWQSLLAEAFSKFGQAWPAAPMPQGKEWPLENAASLWQLPIDTWKRVAEYFSLAPGFMHDGLGNMPKGFFDWWISIPPLGYTRERQAQLQHWGSLSMQYLQAVQDYISVLGEVSKRAIDILGEKIAAASEEQEGVSSLRHVFNLWIDSGEEAYAEYVAKPEFSNLQAQQVNALMRLKQHEQQMIEQVMSTLNMPTRREVDTTHRRVHELRRELRKLESKIESLVEANGIADMEAETKKAASPNSGDSHHV